MLPLSGKKIPHSQPARRGGSPAKECRRAPSAGGQPRIRGAAASSRCSRIHPCDIRLIKTSPLPFRSGNETRLLLDRAESRPQVADSARQIDRRPVGAPLTVLASVGEAGAGRHGQPSEASPGRGSTARKAAMADISLTRSPYAPVVRMSSGRDPAPRQKILAEIGGGGMGIGIDSLEDPDCAADLGM